MITDTTKCIVAFTSYGDRLKILQLAIRDIVNLADYHFVFTVYKDDVPNITPSINRLISDGIIELFVTDVDYKFHKKYIKAMEKYGDTYPIILIDDDWYYTKNTIESLYNAYLETPNYVIGTRSCLIQYDEAYNFTAYADYPRITYELANDLLIVQGGGGVIYPPGFKPFYDFFPDYTIGDDITLNAAALKQGLHKRNINGTPKQIYCNLVYRTASYRKMAEKNLIDLNKYKDIFMKVIANEGVRTSESS